MTVTLVTSEPVPAVVGITKNGFSGRFTNKLLVLIDPCENPDGRARYLAQTLSFAHRTANPDQDDLSHRAVWRRSD